LWTWGAGESGQLGTGRCTNRDIPMRVEILNTDYTDAKISSVSCGFGHTIALSSNGEVYSWGLNCKGQLGINSIKSSKFPNLIPSISNIKKIFCYENSSGCITDQGKVFTWGDGKNYRLMQSNDMENKLLPTHVSQLSSMEVDSFAISENGSVALVKTSLKEVLYGIKYLLSLNVNNS
jgi:alpha-tubulin suppressor-like RCC1 family protein